MPAAGKVVVPAGEAEYTGGAEGADSVEDVAEANVPVDENNPIRTYEVITARREEAPRVQFWDLVTVSVPLSTVTTQYNEYDPDTTGTEEGSFRGSFDGVPGSFRCSEVVADGCTVRIRGEATSPDAKMISDENWTFIADDHLAQVATKRKDGDYLTLGWWLEIPDAVEGEHEFAPFFAGRDPFIVAKYRRPYYG